MIHVCVCEGGGGGGGYHEYIWGCSVHQMDIMSAHRGNIMILRYASDVLMISLRCTEHTYEVIIITLDRPITISGVTVYSYDRYSTGS